MKKFFSLLLSVIMIITVFSCISVKADEEIFYDGQWHTYEGNFFDLKINGTKLDCSVPPIVFNDYSVVPARDVFETLGATVLWRAENERVIVQYEGTEIILQINNQTAYKNGISEKMPIAPKIINSKTMIPARYVSESLGFDVKFDSKTDTILITTPVKEEEPEKPVYVSRLMSYSAGEKDGAFSAVFNLSSGNVKYSSFPLENPSRLAVDIKLTDRAVTIKDTEFSSEFVTKIRLGQQADGTLRIVFDTPKKSDYKVSLIDKKLIVVVGDTNAEPPEEETPKEPAPPIENENPEEPEEPEIVEVDIPAARTITIDAGHGGTDPGAIYTDEEGIIWFEKDINLGVALKVRDILIKNGVKVVMTRDDDTFIELKERAEIANRNKTALFLSVHTNSSTADTAYGIETWGSLEINTILSGVNDKLFAENVQKEIIKSTGGKNRGIKDSETLAVLKYSVMPSVLVEVGFISNEAEREKMFTDSYRNQLAEGIAEGILKTFKDMGV